MLRVVTVAERLKPLVVLAYVDADFDIHSFVDYLQKRGTPYDEARRVAFRRRSEVALNGIEAFCAFLKPLHRVVTQPLPMRPT